MINIYKNQRNKKFKQINKIINKMYSYQGIIIKMLNNKKEKYIQQYQRLMKKKVIKLICLIEHYIL